ncbi:MAG: hypothetical protein ACE1ZS_05890 [Candidatus Poribacteria bacterium]
MTIPRLQCQSCRKYFLITQTENLRDLDCPCGVNITNALKRIATLCGASWPYEQAEKVIRELTGVEVSHDHIKNLCESEAKVIGEEQQQIYNMRVDAVIGEAVDCFAFNDSDADSTCEKRNEANSNKIEKANAKNNLFYIGMDGVYVGEVRREKFIEAKVGIVFTDERATISKGRNILLNKQYVGTFNDSNKFGEKLYCCAKDMGISEQTELVILGDGARWIWRLARMRYPFATLILDWWHLKQRVWETIDYLKQTHFFSDKDALRWGRRLVRMLWHGETNGALKFVLKLGEQLKIEFPVTARERNELNRKSLPLLYEYISNNQEAVVNYQEKKEDGYFVSSVFAEKAIDVLVCRRQKCRGMNWSRSGAENIITLRTLILNDEWENHWEHKQAA